MPLKRAAKAETSALVKRASANLERLKKSKAQESLLHDNLDNYYDDLTAANKQIATLEKMLGEQVDTLRYSQICHIIFSISNGLFQLLVARVTLFSRPSFSLCFDQQSW